MSSVTEYRIPDDHDRLPYARLQFEPLDAQRLRRCLVIVDGEPVARLVFAAYDLAVDPGSLFPVLTVKLLGDLTDPLVSADPEAVSDTLAGREPR